MLFELCNLAGVIRPDQPEFLCSQLYLRTSIFLYICLKSSRVTVFFVTTSKAANAGRHGSWKGPGHGEHGRGV